MINHARTLLLNTHPQNNQRQDAGYEYIPDTFKPIALSPVLTAIRKVLFGATPDTYFLNLRARELLTYIHQTELAEYVYKLDSRVTYWPATSAPFFENVKPTITSVQTVGPPIPLNLNGVFTASDASGITTRQFEITASNTDAIYINIRDINARTTLIVATITDENHTQPIVLPDTKLHFKLNLGGLTDIYALLTELTDAIIVEEYAPDAPIGFESVHTGTTVPAGIDTVKWVVTARANPQPAITSLLPILELMGEPLFLELFGVAPAEPYATFKNLWFDHPLAAYRLAGLVLAFIYRADELRKASNG